jgi:hypothetical protein
MSRDNPRLKCTQIMAILSHRWRCMCKGERSYYVDLALRLQSPSDAPQDRPSKRKIPERSAACDRQARIARLCAVDVGQSPLYLPRLTVIERKQFGRSAALASRASLSPPG